MNHTNTPSQSFCVESWAAWAPGIETPQHWQTFFSTSAELPKDDSQIMADVGFLPAIQRRRLSSLARAAFHVANQCIESGECIPSIFCSIYGETQRTYSLLKSIAGAEDLSPMAFSLSVHNAISGQFGIFFKNTQPSTALSPSDQSYLSAFAEAIGQLNEGANSVLVICYEENLPPFYQPYVSSVSCPVAIGFRLGLASTQHNKDHRYSLTFNNHLAENFYKEVPLLSLIRFFAEAQHTMQQARWQFTAL